MTNNYKVANNILRLLYILWLLKHCGGFIVKRIQCLFGKHRWDGWRCTWEQDWLSYDASSGHVTFRCVRERHCKICSAREWYYVMRG